MKIFYLFLCYHIFLGSNIYAQGLALTFHKAQPDIFVDDPQPIPIAILPLSSQDSLISETLFNVMKNQPKILTRFEIYSYGDLIQQQKFFKIKNLLAYDPECLKILYEYLGVKHIISITQQVKGIELHIRSASSGYTELNNLYLDTDSSTAIKDLLKLFTDNLVAVYEVNGRLNLTATPSDGKFTINAVNYNLPFDSTLAPGKYIVAIKKDGYSPIKDSFVIEPGKTVYKNYYLEPAYSLLKVTISPQFASYKILDMDSLVLIEGTGDVNERLQEGNYYLEIKALAYTKEKRLFAVRENKTINETINLRRSFYPIEKITTNDSIIIKNIKIFPEEYRYEIHYDLIGDVGDTYDIELYLLDKRVKKQKLTIFNIVGDVGDDIKSGNKKKIIWEIVPKNHFDTHSDSINNFSFHLEVD